MMQLYKESVAMDIHAGEALCTRCALAAACAIPLESEGPVLSCGSFRKVNVATLWRTQTKQSGPVPIDGLCGDCGNREACVFRRREGGTWHCEEYC